ncbi:Phosphotyrosyl phosphatase activator [Scheffersomyces coipomensis]|uniref:Phosphotyrosyl phosphatase activator n=1 Tax=Scheffersomyces coipomensis TaxID=1788519 RepID=UPI00315DD795
MEPSKKIFTESDLANFRRSSAYNSLLHTLNVIVSKVKGIEIKGDVLDVSLVTRKNTVKDQKPSIPKLSADDSSLRLTSNSDINGVLAILRHLEELLVDTPPFQGERRFGNLACRTWHDKMNQSIETDIVHNLRFTEKTKPYVADLKYYISNSFGSRMRLDFGTGHELNFVAFIGGLIQLDIIDLQTLSGGDLLVLFANYYDLVRRLILQYNLEPAGSHGVWGLDDHFHFIYILGASQFIEDKNAPMVQQVLSSQVVNEFKSKNLYVNAISFIFKIKQGPFNEHSPIIYDIHSSVSLWTKVLKGLLRMYEVEVLGKFPVVQHFWFGELYSWKDQVTNIELPSNNIDFDNENQDAKLPSEDLTKRTTLPTTKAPWAMPTTRTYHLPKERDLKNSYNNKSKP